jgi:hypothetical protein
MVQGAVTAGLTATAVAMIVPACVDITGVSAATCLAATTGAVIGGTYHGCKYSIKHIRRYVKERQSGDVGDGKIGSGQA